MKMKCFVRNLLCFPLWQLTPASSRRRQLILHQGVVLHTTQQHLLRRWLLQVTIQQRWTRLLHCQPCCHPQRLRNNLFLSISSLTKVFYATKCLWVNGCHWLLDSLVLLHVTQLFSGVIRYRHVHPWQHSLGAQPALALLLIFAVLTSDNAFSKHIWTPYGICTHGIAEWYC